MAENVEQGEQQPIVFNCKKLNQNLLGEIDFSPEHATQDHDVFIKRFRSLGKHSTRVTLRVPELPSKEEVYIISLPAPEFAYNTDDDVLPRVPPGRGRGRSKKLAKRGQMNVVSKKVRASILVSMTLDEQTLILLYERANMYLLGLRDAENRWWGFGNEDGKLFPGARALMFSESYTSMSTRRDVIVGHNQFKIAFHVLCNPELRESTERKEAIQIMIAVTSESGRLVQFSNEVGRSISDLNGVINVILGGIWRKMMRSWGRVCHVIIDNSDVQKRKEKIEDILPSADIDIIQQLKNEGMVYVNDASMSYGLLLAKVHGGGSPSFLTR